MEFKAYQDAVVGFALPSAQSASYLVPGAIAEVGEVLGVIAKWERDEFSVQELRKRLTKELGDCAWFGAAGVRFLADADDLHREDTEGLIAQIRDQLKKFYADLELNDFTAGSLFLLTSVQELGNAWGEFLEGKNEVDFQSLFSTFYIAARVAAAMMLIDWEDVQEGNITKLSGRQAVGTIKGDGDDR